MRKPPLTRLALALLAGVAVTASALAKDPGGWEKVSDKDGIIVYEKNLDGSDTISLKGEALIHATVHDIAEVMKDSAIAGDWVPLVAERRTLKPVSPTERIEYTHVHMPWPLTDRYFINVGKAEYLDNGVLRLFVKSFDQPEPGWLEDDKVLGELKYSEFLLTPADGGQSTRLSLEVNTDPKGLIPKWIVNVAQKSWPRDFLTGLMGQLKKRGQLHDGPVVAH